jgi:regulator of sirC expression with transglutaminase-like and TPR domain
MKPFWQILGALALITGTAAAEDANPDAGAAARYETCLAQVDLDARAALTSAQSWAEAGGGLPARHCEALALVALEDYMAAGQALLALAYSKPEPEPGLRADMLAQAGNAFLLAGKGENARQALDLALLLRPDDASLLLDRARAYGMEQQWAAAIADLNMAIAAEPGAPEPYILRAAAKRQSGDLFGARKDIDMALMRDTRSNDALVERGLLRLVSGDKAGARTDFEAVLANAPGSPAGRVAKSELDRLR